MNVSDLQNTLGVIRQLLTSAGAKAKADEIAEFSDALEPFRSMTAKKFAAELNGLAGKSKAPGKGKKLTSNESETLIRELPALYEQASSLTHAEIDARTEPLFRLGKPAVIRAAESVGLAVDKGMTIAQIAGEVKKRIESRMGAAQKTGAIIT